MIWHSGFMEFWPWHLLGFVSDFFHSSLAWYGMAGYLLASTVSALALVLEWLKCNMTAFALIDSAA